MKLRLVQFWVYGIILFSISSCTYYFGPNRLVTHFKNTPATTAVVYNYNASFAKQRDYDTTDLLIQHYAAKALPEKKVVGQTDAVRMIIAKLSQRREVERINALIMQLKPWAKHGTEWALNPHGDYDFTEITWCSLLYLFGNEPTLLYPETRDHLVHVLIGYSGEKHALRTPGMLGLMRETENHILMGEVSRYLKNQWLHEHGDTAWVFDNQRNGMESWMLNHLDEKFCGGFYEFNSNPYSGYTFTALNTLFSFTHSDTVRNATNKVMNEIMYEFSLSSINQSRYPPYRRQPHRAAENSFEGDPISSIARVLVAVKTHKPLNIAQKQHGIMTLLLHYRLSDTLTDHLTQKDYSYFALLGHGRKGSPEIYTGGLGYVLSAGGVQRGAISQLAARPVMLLLNDHVTHRDSCFYICSQGKMNRWNNTGLYRNFACANDSLHIPPQYQPVYEKNNWKIFQSATGECRIITYNQKGIALLLVSPDTRSSVTRLLDKLIAENKDNDLRKQFTAPVLGTVTYCLHSPKNRWVIRNINGDKQDRKFDKWPRMVVKE